MTEQHNQAAERKLKGEAHKASWKAYPHPNSPQTSVNMRAEQDRAAFKAGYLAARRAAPAVGEDGLTPLPKAVGHVVSEYVGCGIRIGAASWEVSAPEDGADLYTAEQVRQAQREAVASLRMSLDAAVALASETIDARNAEIADLRAQLARQGLGEMVLPLLHEARATLETWKDVAPAVSLCADIDKVLLNFVPGRVST